MQDGETPYNGAGKNLKIRKLITQLMEANLNDDEDGEGDDGEGGDDEEWEEVTEEEKSKIK